MHDVLPHPSAGAESLQTLRLSQMSKLTRFEREEIRGIRSESVRMSESGRYISRPLNDCLDERERRLTRKRTELDAKWNNVSTAQ